MNARKTTTLVLAAASLAFGLTACEAATDDQRASAVTVLKERGFQDIEFVGEDMASPLGESMLHFTTRVGDCRSIDVDIRPERNDILFVNLSKAQIDAFFAAAPIKDNIGNAIFSACKAPLG